MMRILIFGTGRFSQVMQDFFGSIASSVTVVSKDGDLPVMEQIDIIVPCIPLSAFSDRFAMIQPYLTTQCILDVGSVKMFPLQVFGEYGHVMYTHPMFGPDSVASNGGLSGLPWVVCEYPQTDQTQRLIQAMSDAGCRIVRLSCDEHDRLAARSQGVTHVVGRMLESFDLQSTAIDTQGAKLLHQIMKQTCNDTPQLFRDLQTLNPYTQTMRLELGRAYESVSRSLLSLRRRTDVWRVGIQGGPGSFNEQSILDYAHKNGIDNIEIVYLYTTEAVVRAVHHGEVDFGHFAVCNSRGGVVDESIASIASYQYQVLAVNVIAIQHYLMVLPNTKQSDLTGLMAHPQVFAQCQERLRRDFGDLALRTGEGEMIDTARCAQALRDGEIDKNTGIVGNARLAEIYGLEIVSEGLADDPHNKTSFFVIQRMGG